MFKRLPLLFVLLQSCGSLGGYANVKPVLDDPVIVEEEPVERDTVDSDSIWDTGTTGETAVFEETGLFAPKPFDPPIADTYSDTF